MTKDEIKNLLENYKFEYQFYNEKFAELEVIKDNYSKTIKILKEFNQDENKKSIDNIIKGYLKDLLEHEAKLSKLKEVLKSIESLLDIVTQPFRTVLYYRYIHGLSIEEIATKMNYSTQRIYQFHDLGIQQVIDKEKKEDAI